VNSFPEIIVAEHVDEDGDHKMARIKVKEGWSPNDAETKEPAVICFEAYPLHEKAVTALEEFSDRFRIHKYYGEKGRGSELLRTGDPTTYPKIPVELRSTALRRHLSIIDQNYIDSPWVWIFSGVHTSCGPEHMTLASVRYQVSGVRKVVCCAYDSLCAYARKAIPEGVPLTVAACQDLLRTADAELLGTMHQCGARVYAATVTAGQATYIPAGFIVAEQVLNKEDCTGFRWTPVLDTIATPAFLELISVMLPAELKSIPNNSQMALVTKVLGAMHRVSDTTDRSRISKMIKSEFLKHAPEPMYGNASSASGANQVKREAPPSQAEPAPKAKRGGGGAKAERN